MRALPAPVRRAEPGASPGGSRRRLLQLGGLSLLAIIMPATAPAALEVSRQHLMQVAAALTEAVESELRRAETALLTAAAALAPGEAPTLSVAALDRVVRAAATALGVPVAGLDAQLAPLVDSELPAGTPLPASTAGQLAAEALVTMRPTAGSLGPEPALGMAVPVARPGGRPPLGVLVARLSAERLAASLAAALVAEGPAEGITAAWLISAVGESGTPQPLAWIRPGTFPVGLALPDATADLVEAPPEEGAAPQLVVMRRLARVPHWAVALAAPRPVAPPPVAPGAAVGGTTPLAAIALGAAGFGALLGTALARRRRPPVPPLPADAEDEAIAAISAAEQEARQSLAELRAICDTIPVGLALLNPRGVLLSANLRLAGFAGLPAESLAGRLAADVLPPPLAEAILVGQAQVLREGRPVLDAPLAVEAPGVLRHSRNLLVSCHPVRGPSGRIEAVSATVQDVTERARAEAGRDLLVHELNHRVKNTLVTVQTLAQQTLRNAGDDPAAFERSFGERLRTLARAHDLLTAHAWGATELRLVVQAALAPWLGDVRVTTEAGPEAMLRPTQAQALVLALHELATNAAKHGALTRDEGRVRLGWSLDRDGMVALRWVESGGPLVPPQPARRGFGTRLLERALRQDLGSGAAPEIIYDPLGLRVTIRFRPGGTLMPAALPGPVPRAYSPSVVGWNSSSGATLRAASPSASA
ncbi:MAG TPA: HWE histidine kinase domain-containing protein [Falsiroseomonas sp.]|jgi:PAS domain S-box-containing protein|nr:HWE histidine kinase domain-containing protein [Falsiroseomonas sp.]